MALSLKRVRGRDLVFAITGGGTITALRDLKFNITQDSYPAKAADATFKQKVVGDLDTKGSYSMWLGTEGVAPTIGTTITVLTAKVSTDDTIPVTLTDSTTYGLLKVTGIGQSYQDAPAWIDVTFEGGYI